MHVRTFLRAGHPPTLLSAFLYFDISFMVWVLIGALGVYIARDVGLTPSQKGLLVAIPLLGGALVRIPMGVLTDRIGPKKTGAIAQCIVLLPLLWGWRFGHDLPQLMAVGLLLGVAGGSFAVALPLASRWYPRSIRGWRWESPEPATAGPCWPLCSRPDWPRPWGGMACLGSP